MESEETKSLEDPRPVLLVTTVDIGDGVTGRVEVRLGDDPEDAARAFCATNGLPESVVLPLAAHLQSNLDLGPPSEQVCGVFELWHRMRLPQAWRVRERGRHYVDLDARFSRKLR